MATNIKPIVIDHKPATRPQTGISGALSVIMRCACGDEYILGVTGTVHGCDRCQGITRNPVPDPFEMVFTEEGQQS